MSIITRQSKLFSKTRKEAPADAEVASHQLLTRAGFIDQLASGIYTLLPLGWRVNNKVADIIRSEMMALDAQEITMPSLQPASIWKESGRLETMDPPLFRLQDRHDKDLVLGPTHEEVITILARNIIESYQDLPQAVFQIQTKYRNEQRATGGLLRVREFQMKDLYSFHRTPAELEEFYDRVKQAYLNIFKACDLTAHPVTADTGTIGGSYSHEFQVEATAGEDKIAHCESCDFAVNADSDEAQAKACPDCRGTLIIKSCIESGHIFQLKDVYSDKMKATFVDEDGKRKPLMMGCYGIGVGRLLATIAETHHDDQGLIWPASVSPYHLHLIPVQLSALGTAQEYAQQYQDAGFDVLLDDRDVSAGQKFAESDLMGIAHRVIVSDKTIAVKKVELVNRATGDTNLVAPEKVIDNLKL